MKVNGISDVTYTQTAQNTTTDTVKTGATSKNEAAAV